MKIIYLPIIVASVLLVLSLQPVHAQEHYTANPRNVTLLISFDSPSLQRCCDSIALNHDGNILAYSISSFDAKLAGWKSSVSLYFFKNQTSRSLDLNKNLDMIGELNFSPDDTKLLFVGSSCDKTQSSTTYYVFNIFDTVLHCNTMSNIRSVDWMPDGSIVMLRNNEKNDTLSVYQNGTEKLLYVKQIRSPYVSINSSHVWSISASPDGKKIALWYAIRFDHKTQILDVNTGKIMTTIGGGHPKWSNDGDTLSYTLPTSTGMLSNGARGVDTSMNLLDVNNNKTTSLYDIPTGVEFASITPNGTKVLYATNPTEPYKFFGIKAGIYAINLINSSSMVPPPIQQPITTIKSPLKQFKSGIHAEDIVCRPDMQLLIENQENFPICVKLDSVPSLLHQDWSYPANCKYYHDPVTIGVEGLVMIEKNANNQSSGKSYSPANSTVVIGWNNTVSWINQDVVSSSITSDWNLFDSGGIPPGNVWKHTFDCAGNYGYHSEPHPWMKGWIRVLPPGR